VYGNPEAESRGVGAMLEEADRGGGGRARATGAAIRSWDCDSDDLLSSAAQGDPQTAVKLLARTQH